MSDTQLVIRITADGSGAVRVVQATGDQIRQIGPASQQAAAATQGATQQMTRGFGILRSAALGVAAALSVQQLIDFGARAVAAAGSLGELSEQLGISTDAIQAYRYVAVQAGVSNEQLEQAFIRLNDTIGTAARGSKESIDVFERLGVRILDAGGQVRSTEEVFNDVADALVKIENPAQRAAAANDLFGRSGARLLPLLSGGAAGLARFREEARAAGAILGAETIEAADAAADAFARNQLVVQNLAAEIGVHLVNAIGAAIGALGRIPAALAAAFPQLFGNARQAGSARVATAQGNLEDIDREIAAFERDGRPTFGGSGWDRRLAELRQRRAAAARELEAITTAERRAAAEAQADLWPDPSGAPPAGAAGATTCAATSS